MQNTSIFALQTNDIDEMATAFGGPNLAASQLSSGFFVGNLLQVQLEDIQCWQIRWNQKIQLSGSMAPDTISLWIPLMGNYRSIWNGFECRGQQIILNLGNKIDYTHLESEIVACTVISSQRLVQSIASHYLEILKYLLSNYGLLTPDPIKLQLLRNHLEEIFSLAVSSPELLSRPHLNQMIIENLLSSITELLLSCTSLPKKTNRSLTRTLKLKQAVEYIRENLHQPLSIEKISSEIGMSGRSLIYGFTEIFGMGPMEYCKSSRLNAVRRQLKVADAKTDKVAEIAKRWGFHHMGHFSANYRAIFGELPSETLRRSH